MIYKSSTKQHKRENWDNIKDTYSWNAETDYRLHPEKYKVGKGEQGVLLCEPYKSEILPHWRFKDASISEISSTKIFDLFQAYLAKADFVGADMARKFLQMGYSAAQALRMAAAALRRSQSALGAYYRRLCARLDRPQAITATAHKLARLIYAMLTKGTEYVDEGQDYYEQRYQQRVVHNLSQRAEKLGFQLVPIPQE